MRALLYAAHSQSDNSLSICNEIIKDRLLTNDQNFKISLLKSLIYLLQKHYDDFFAISDCLYGKDKSLFLSSIKFWFSRSISKYKKRGCYKISRGFRFFYICKY